MKKFLMGLILNCVAMFSFSVVGSCMTEQTIKSVYLPISPDSWLKSEIEQQAEDIYYVNLSEDWYQKVMAPSKTIVDKRPRTADDSPIFVKEVLQNPKDFNLSIPINENTEGIFSGMGPQLASFNVKLNNNNNKSIEEIVNKTAKPKKVKEVKFMNIGAGTTYEEEIAMMESEVPAAQSTDKWEREPCLKIAELPFNLRTDNLKVIPVSLNFGTLTCGYIVTPSLDAPVENAVIWFTHVHPRYERRQFYNLKSVLDTHWGIIEAQAIGICPA
ncbi:MAG: hypothetical protein LBF82_03740 [Lactobacillales bacterium]|jgi:hypothetical protein|nr:hypothetical protein [Lactobacillales bacterium]